MKIKVFDSCCQHLLIFLTFCLYSWLALCARYSNASCAMRQRSCTRSQFSNKRDSSSSSDNSFYYCNQKPSKALRDVPHGRDFYNVDREEDVCVPESHWCNSFWLDNGDCPNNTQGIVSNCLHYHWNDATLGTSYIYVDANMPWQVAEDYCQNYDSSFHILTPDSSAELQNVQKQFYRLTSQTKRYKDSPSIIDPLGKSCKSFDDPQFDPMNNAFWLGIYYSSALNTWTSADDSTIDWTIKINELQKLRRSVISGSNQKVKTTLSDIQESEMLEKSQFKSEYFPFVIGSSFELHRNPFPMYNIKQPRVVCKARKIFTEPRRVNQLPRACVGGYQCPNDEKYTCYKGYGHTGSKLCDGVVDCDAGADEDPNSCFSMRGTHKGVPYLFVSQPQTLEAAGQYCTNQGGFLPSIHDDADIKFLTSLPSTFQNYAKQLGWTRNKTALGYFAHKDWLIYTGYVLNSPVQDDGTQARLTVETVVEDRRFERQTANDDKRHASRLVLRQGRLSVFDPLSELLYASNPFVCQLGKSQPSASVRIVCTSSTVLISCLFLKFFAMF